MTALDATWPDLETSSDAYARRFGGEAGAYLLDVQRRGITGLLPEGTINSILDVGGGHCQLVEPLVQTGASVTIFGSDPRCAERLSRDLHAGAVSFVAGDLLATPYADASFDLVTSIRLLAHMEHWHVLIAELCRVARHSVIIDYPSLAGLNGLTALTWPIKRAIEGDTRTYRSFWPARVAGCFARHGFRRAGEFRQFTLPMGVHRLAGAPVARVEEMLRASGVTAWAGNPVLARFDRVDA
jgi:hypothetical protein